jgi:hypothetical protein
MPQTNASRVLTFVATAILVAAAILLPNRFTDSGGTASPLFISLQVVRGVTMIGVLLSGNEFAKGTFSLFRVLTMMVMPVASVGLVFRSAKLAPRHLLPTDWLVLIAAITLFLAWLIWRRAHPQVEVGSQSVRTDHSDKSS